MWVIALFHVASTVWRVGLAAYLFGDVLVLALALGREWPDGPPGEEAKPPRLLTLLSLVGFALAAVIVLGLVVQWHMPGLLSG